MWARTGISRQREKFLLFCNRRRGYAFAMLTPTQCKRLSPALRHIPDDELQQLLDELYRYADFFCDGLEAEQGFHRAQPRVLPEK